MKEMHIEWLGPFPNKRIIENQVSEESGIYCLMIPAEHNKVQFTYVGKAKNLRERLLQHLSDSEQNNCIKSKLKKTFWFDIAIVKNESERKGIEKYIFDLLQPQCNEYSPEDVEPIKVNLAH
jgi:excinuclease UvrABC nuclease subunit